MLEKIGNRILKILISIDQFANVLLGGDEDHTISGRVGYAAIQGKRWALIMEKIINTLFFFQEDHCRKSIEWDEVRKIERNREHD